MDIDTGHGSAASGVSTSSQEKATVAGSSPCTFMQPDGSAIPPGACHDVCNMDFNGYPALPMQPCTIGTHVFGNLPIVDTNALPAATNSTLTMACGANCSFIEYAEMASKLPADICSSSCFQNELAWASSILLRPHPPNTTACNPACQEQHAAFLARIQQPKYWFTTSNNIHMSGAASTSSRRTLRPISIMIMMRLPVHLTYLQGKFRLLQQPTPVKAIQTATL
ncbi:hypothetical protein ABBQ32_010258 [Trebouxia sp. C0010 RCD-2024]